MSKKKFDINKHAQKEVDRITKNKTEDELFDEAMKSLLMLPENMLDMLKVQVYRQVENNIKERWTNKPRPIDELLAKYRNSKGFMQLWNKLGYADKELVNLYIEVTK